MIPQDREVPATCEIWYVSLKDLTENSFSSSFTVVTGGVISQWNITLNKVFLIVEISRPGSRITTIRKDEEPYIVFRIKLVDNILERNIAVLKTPISFVKSSVSGIIQTNTFCSFGALLCVFTSLFYGAKDHWSCYSTLRRAHHKVSELMCPRLEWIIPAWPEV